MRALGSALLRATMHEIRPTSNYPAIAGADGARQTDGAAIQRSRD